MIERTVGVTSVMNLLNSEVHIPGFTEVEMSGVDVGRRSANPLMNKTLSTRKQS